MYVFINHFPGANPLLFAKDVVPSEGYLYPVVGSSVSGKKGTKSPSSNGSVAFCQFFWLPHMVLWQLKSPTMIKFLFGCEMNSSKTFFSILVPGGL